MEMNLEASICNAPSYKYETYRNLSNFVPYFQKVI